MVSENKKYDVGASIRLNKHDIMAAYRYQQREYLKEDALEQLYWFVFGRREVGSTSYECRKAEFEHEYGFSYEEAESLVDDFVDEFMNEQDCNVADNDTWNDVIITVLDEHKDELDEYYSDEEDD